MLKTLIIAEKPSQMRLIKSMLENKQGQHFTDNNSYHESDQYYLSCLIGHILETWLPDDYGFKVWKAQDLPIIPEQFKYKYKKGLETRGKLLSFLAQKSSAIINATDPDREGEGIFRIWYAFEGIDKPVKRFRSKSLAPSDLFKNWLVLEPSEKYDNLATAHRLRQEADWLIGMNGSRAYSIAGKSLLSIGRVQTATLSLIVKRDEAVEGYKESHYYSLVGEWANLPFIHFDDHGTKFESLQALEYIKEGCIETEFRVVSYDEEQKVQNPPMPFSLHDLQKVANAKFGFSLDKTLEIAQSLYEKGLITYPRTSSSFLPPADIALYYEVISKFAKEDEKKLLVSEGERVPCVKDSEEAHTALIPTGETPSGLSKDELKVFEMIVDRFIIAFLKPRLYTQYVIVISNDKYQFRSTVNKTVYPGFTGLYKEEEETNEDNNEREIAFSLTRDSLPTSKRFDNLYIQKKKRAKPSYFTPGTLVTAMMSVGRMTKVQEYKEILNDIQGLGTEATRQNIPVELERRNYIVKQGKYLVSTVKGRQLIAWVTPALKSPELTAEWESKLRNIEKGKYDPDTFSKEIIAFTRQITTIDSELKDVFVNTTTASKKQCPKCKNSLTEYEKGFFCNKECGWSFFKVMSGKRISSKEIDTLFTTGTTGVIDGFTKKDRSGSFSARIVFSKPDFKPQFSFDTTIEYTCLLCKSDMQEFNKCVKCSSSLCELTVWKEISGKKLSDSQIKTLLTKGKTNKIDGFISTKNGKPFSAVLSLDKNQKKVVFEFA